jgi:hypothetical protein
MADIAATLDGSDIDFTVDRVISGLPEYRQAARARVSNEVSMVNADYGIDLAQELGQTGRVSTIGVRASSAIMNDERFISATLTNSSVSRAGGIETVALSFLAVAQDGTEVPLDVLVANGEVTLVP